MRRAYLSLSLLLLLFTTQLQAATEVGVVTTVGKGEFKMKSEWTPGEITIKLGNELSKDNFLGGKVEDLKKGVRVLVNCKKQGDSYICTSFQVRVC